MYYNNFTYRYFDKRTQITNTSVNNAKTNKQTITTVVHQGITNVFGCWECIKCSCQPSAKRTDVGWLGNVFGQTGFLITRTHTQFIQSMCDVLYSVYTRKTITITYDDGKALDGTGEVIGRKVDGAHGTYGPHVPSSHSKVRVVYDWYEMRVGRAYEFHLSNFDRFLCIPQEIPLKLSKNASHLIA